MGRALDSDEEEEEEEDEFGPAPALAENFPGPERSPEMNPYGDDHGGDHSVRHCVNLRVPPPFLIESRHFEMHTMILFPSTNSICLHNSCL